MSRRIILECDICNRGNDDDIRIYSYHCYHLGINPDTEKECYYFNNMEMCEECKADYIKRNPRDKVNEINRYEGYE